ncbi:DUF4225 domain-containing protein [Pseudomonas sp. LS1212]|uniref:DUF4225 domain-containing protein n=1 Tax=Pseudomonas sp. LS1212 TaxID=2972478 RepID=UPI00215C7F71|nr:DUF4225 domain-containing protein [Pseudomonas sp. LS1212]UVJ43937.1 DUF4225 domain-containing protein [Pseudomonas sp. LS1212]
MGQLKNNSKPSSCDFWKVSHAASYLANQACTLGARHIKDGTLRLQFNREVSYYARSIVNDVEQGKKSPEQGLKEIKNEQNHLLSQSWEVTQKGVGVIAGVLQFGLGAGMCYGSAGTLCIFPGSLLMTHGANNIYENGRNLLKGRSDTQGPVRKAYHSISKWMGGDEFEGNMAYGAFDLGMSAYVAGRLLLKPDAWRLFRHVRTDYERAYKKTSAGAILFDRTADAITANGMREKWENEQ